MSEENKLLDTENKFLHSVIKAHGELLTCYRIGRIPRERIFTVLAKYRKLYGNRSGEDADEI